MSLEIITVTEENLEKEHICCAISNNKDCQVASKKEWMSQRFADGLIFKKGNVRGKCFIEYIPAEKAWAPIVADGYMYIDCLWVAGQFKGHGYSNELLDACIIDSKERGKKGLVILSSKKKQAFLVDPKFLRYKGFLLADTAEPEYELMYFPFYNEGGTESGQPRFMDQVRHPEISEKGFVLYYTAQCPYTAKYVPLIKEIAGKRGTQFKDIRIKTTEQAKNAPAAVTTYALFYNGKFVTHEILSAPKFERIIDEIV